MLPTLLYQSECMSFSIDVLNNKMEWWAGVPGVSTSTGNILGCLKSLR